MCVCVCVCVYIIEIYGKVDKSNTYNRFRGVIFCSFISFLSTFSNSLSHSLSLSLYIYIYKCLPSRKNFTQVSPKRIIKTFPTIYIYVCVCVCVCASQGSCMCYLPIGQSGSCGTVLFLTLTNHGEISPSITPLSVQLFNSNTNRILGKA